MKGVGVISDWVVIGTEKEVFEKDLNKREELLNERLRELSRTDVSPSKRLENREIRISLLKEHQKYKESRSL